MTPARQAWIASICITLFAVPSAAQTADETLMKSARSVARIFMIEPVCSTSYLIDKKVLGEATQIILNDGLQRFGLETLRATANRVRPEMISEIKMMGVKNWCAEQRLRYRVPGFPEFFGSPLKQ